MEIQNTRSYNELIQFQTFEERFNYLRLIGQVGFDTFGNDRYMNQMFYQSAEWRHVRNFVITRDNGCDLGCPDRPIFGTIYVHHINPITKEDIERSDYSKLLDPNNLICVSFDTHNAIHYGVDLAKPLFAERKPNDHCPWKQ